MVADLTVAAPDRVISANQSAASLDAAVALGKQNGARYVVAGGFVTVDRELRVTGQVVDVETGKAVAGLKASGDPGQIFHMEDAAWRLAGERTGFGPAGRPHATRARLSNRRPISQVPTSVPDAGIYANPTAHAAILQFLRQRSRARDLWRRFECFHLLSQHLSERLQTMYYYPGVPLLLSILLL